MATYQKLCEFCSGWSVTLRLDADSAGPIDLVLTGQFCSVVFPPLFVAFGMAFQSSFQSLWSSLKSSRR
ncbi:MAG: hypothetical protein ABJY83_03040, partial [Roseibium sp.]